MSGIVIANYIVALNRISARKKRRAFDDRAAKRSCGVKAPVPNSALARFEGSLIGNLLSALVVASFLGLGAGALAAPRTLAENYGIPVDDAAGIAYVRSVGARDAILGLIILAFMIRRERSALATTVGLCALVGASDFSLVAAKRGTAAPLSLAIHASGTVGLLAIAAIVGAGL